MEIENDAIVIRRVAQKPREGWAESSKEIAAAGDDKLVMAEFPNDDDKELVW